MDGPRACRSEELDGLRRLVDTVFRPNGDLSIFDEFPNLFAPENCERLRVVAEDGRIVSSINYVARTADILGNLVRIGSLGAVSTYEECRGRGYATALLADTFDAMRRERIDVVLISGQRGLYQRAGCAIAGREVRFRLERAHVDAIPRAPIELREATDADIPALITVYQREPVRFIRSPRDWRGFLAICRLAVRGIEPPFGVRRCWLISRGGEPVGHVIIGFGRDRIHPTAGIAEFSGPRDAVLAAVREIADRYGAEAIGGAILPGDPLGGMVAATGATLVPGLLGGHRFGILHDGILARYGYWLAERIGPDAAPCLGIEKSDAGWRLLAGDTAIEVGDDEAMNGMLFGNGADGLHGDGAAVALWRAVLPLPWLIPGMNYI